ncbi:uncharacterized protein LOC133782272 [Humulus lupulus]|uniref:uncharacterized protein LOC133782272 n=1 Tax=Humulus lupulus TaxID=3486 RepID=UPI002B402E99|nr:uncharacterized protein LOC133782272 [Humulus lupulus]
MAIDPNPTPSASAAITPAITSAAGTSAPAATPTTTANTNLARPFTNPPPSRPISPLQQPQPLHPHHQLTTTTAASVFSSQQPPYAAHALPLRAPVPPYSNSQLVKSPNDPSSPAHGIPYPVASSGRGFISKVVRPDQTVTVANPGGGSGYPARPFVAAGFHHAGGVRGPHLESVNANHAAHMVRPMQNLQQHLYHPHLGSAVGPVKGVPVSVQSKVSSSSSAPDCNGHKDMRDKSRDDTLTVVKDRKVRIVEGASLYALCRSWLRNGTQDEAQPQYGNGPRSLPKPYPISVATGNLQKKESPEEYDDGGVEGEESVEHLSADDLLKGHVKRAKRVRARLRELRLKRIARYKSRLALLLPPLAEQFRSDSSAGT